MNVKGIKRPKDLHFEVPEALADAINDLIDAMERDDRLFLDCFMDEVEGRARMVKEEYDDWIYNYYLNGGWHADVVETNGQEGVAN